MEQNNHKFRLRLNLFDAIVLVVVLGEGRRPPPPRRCSTP